MAVTRFHPCGPYLSIDGMREDPQGEYVKYEDYLALLNYAAVQCRACGRLVSPLETRDGECVECSH